MIINLPTSDALNTTAVKLYFRAWHGIMEMLHDFDLMFAGSASAWSGSEDDDCLQERNEYIEAAQEDLHAILSIVQQSNELALKARIAAVSPYLLLLNSDISFNATANDTDFATLRTLDAVDLPKAVNSLTQTPVSTAYIQRYGELRLQRNQYAHLGNTSAPLEPMGMCASMVGQYIELWPDRPWLRDRVDCLAHGREGFFDGKHWSPLQEVLLSLDYDRVLIPAAGFRQLFGVKKAAVKFACFQCLDDWAISRNGPTAGEAPTAYYDGETSSMHCLICDADFPATARVCSKQDCDGKFAAPSTADFGAELCFTCGR